MTALSGQNIFVLEDEFILAWELEEILRDAGATVVGPAHHIAGGLALIEGSQKIDAAVLDININGQESIPVALALEEKGIPFVYTTGYGRDSQKARKAPVLDKPYTPSQLVDSVCALVKKSAP